jgi:hypothetical protein
MTGTSTITSNAVDVTNSDSAAIEITWTGTPTGTFVVQGAVRNDAGGAPVNFQNITLSATLSASGSAGSHLVNLSGIGYTWIRVSYTNVSGTGSVSAWATVKGA